MMSAWGEKTQRRQVVFRGDRMREARKQKGFTQVSLAGMLEISRPQVANLENETSEPSLKTLVLIAYCLEVSTDYLLDLLTFVPKQQQSEPLPFE